MTYVPVHCPDCLGVDVVRYGKQRHGEQRYRCNNADCPRHIFLLTFPLCVHGQDACGLQVKAS
jgi:transposase-like protein